MLMATETPAERAARLKREREEALRLRQAEMDKKMRAAAEKFKASSENDSPGYKKGGKVKKYEGGGGIRKLLGAVSPLYAAMNPEDSSGLLSKFVGRSRKRRPDGTEMTEGEEAASGRPTMRSGGKIKKYARGGGIESKGKTKGRFV